MQVDLFSLHFLGLERRESGLTYIALAMDTLECVSHDFVEPCMSNLLQWSFLLYFGFTVVLCNLPFPLWLPLHLSLQHHASELGTPTCLLTESARYQFTYSDYISLSL